MLSRGFRICLGVGSVLVLFALGLHVLYRFYNAPADAEYDLLNVFAGTFASTILAFFIGALLFDYQVERAEAKRNEQLRTLLVAELNEIAEDLDLANATGLHMFGGPEVKAVITHVQPTVVEEAVKGGFFGPLQAQKALRLARNMRAYNAMISYLLSLLSSGATRDPDSEQLVLHATGELEEARRAIVADARLLAEL